MSTTVVRTLPSDHLTPVRAYAALRAQSPGRSSFLFESATPGGPWGRHAILGYRAVGEALYPRKGDPFDVLEQDLNLGDAAESLAAGLAGALVGFIAYEALHPMYGVEAWPDEILLARMIRSPTVVVFDHAAQTMTIAGPSLDAVRRCVWELGRGPEMLRLAPPEPGELPEWLDALPTDDAYAAKAEEARRRVAAGEASELTLARTFRAPLRGADPFDAYRALRLLSPSEHLFFLDFADTPVAPGLTLLGASQETLLRRAPGAPSVRGPMAEVREAFVAAAPTGMPRDRAAQIIRELERHTRMLHGGAVGYFLPGGGVELAASRSTLVLHQGYFEVSSSAPITAAGAPGAEAEASLRGARLALAAVVAAYKAEEAREAAAKHKAEVERVAAEKAAAEQAAAEKAAAERAAAEQAAEAQPEEGGAAEDAATPQEEGQQ